MFEHGFVFSFCSRVQFGMVACIRLETNKIQNCSYFGFGGFFGLREQPIKPAFQHFKTMVNPSIVTVLSAHRCETEKLQIRRSKF